MRLLLIVSLAILLAGCAATASLKEANYLSKEYGNVKENAVVHMPSGASFRVWVHKTKPKMIVGEAAGAAFVGAAVYGASYGAIAPSAIRVIMDARACPGHDGGDASVRVTPCPTASVR